MLGHRTAFQQLAKLHTTYQAIKNLDMTKCTTIQTKKSRARIVYKTINEKQIGTNNK